MTTLAISDLDVFYGAAQALRGVSLEVETGKVCCLLGRNGVGKTTLLRTIIGQLKPRRGQVLLEGADITSFRPFERAKSGIAYVPQGREIFPLLTVKENLETGFAHLPRRERKLPPEVFELFPVLATMLGRRGAILRQAPLNYPCGLREMNVEELDGHRLRLRSEATGPADGVALAEDSV
jgi:urea transport system ATP-binding protein